MSTLREFDGVENISVDIGASEVDEEEYKKLWMETKASKYQRRKEGRVFRQQTIRSIQSKCL